MKQNGRMYRSRFMCGDKIIVIPALEKENVSWVLEDLPE